jgi:hypothetical protein
VVGFGVWRTEPSGLVHGVGIRTKALDLGRCSSLARCRRYFRRAPRWRVKCGDEITIGANSLVPYRMGLGFRPGKMREIFQVRVLQGGTFPLVVNLRNRDGWRVWVARVAVTGCLTPRSNNS